MRILTWSSAALRAGQCDRAAELLGRVIEKYPNDPGLAFRMGRILIAAGRLQEAEKWLEMGLPHLLRNEEIEEKAGSLFLAAIPRSASTNLSRTLATATGRRVLEIGFGDMIPNFNVRIQSAYLTKFAEGGFVSHSHANATQENLRALIGSGVSRIFVQLRDPRQVLSSMHKYSLRSEMMLSSLNRLWPGYEFFPVKEQFSLLFEHYYPSLISWCRDWIKASNDPPAGLNICIGKFEDMIADEEPYRSRLTEFFGLAPSVFRQISEKDRRVPSDKEWLEHLHPDESARIDEMLDGTGYDGVATC